MKVVIVGLGIQGKKRKEHLGKDLIATVDPYNKKANFKDIRDVPLNIFDTVFVCTPDIPKFDIISYCLKNKKHVLVEKPLLLNKLKEIKVLEKLAIKNNVIFVDSALQMPLKKDLFVDSVHFSPNGMKHLAKIISEKILEINELSKP